MVFIPAFFESLIYVKSECIGFGPPATVAHTSVVPFTPRSGDSRFPPKKRML